MPRYKLTIEYDGRPFVGWQIQENGPSVQGGIANAIEAFTGQRIIPSGAGRTDAGVHALGQVAHVDFAKEWPTRTVQDALNHHLRPNPIAILDAEMAELAFDARFSATARHYLYRIISRRAPLTLDAGRVWRIPQELDAERMNDAAQALVGRHDFTTFRAAQCQAKSPVKTLDRLVVFRKGNEIHIEASARSFMHNQVRSMVGSLKYVGEGRWSKADLVRALKACNRASCGQVAPADGLYLTRVDYDRAVANVWK